MQKLHLYCGIALLVVFALSGQYLQSTLPAFDGVIDGQRMMYRASHVYLLFIGLLHTVLGLYYQSMLQGIMLRLQQLASVLLLLAAGLLLAAFATEPAQYSSDRTLTLLGCVLALTGVGLMLVLELYRRWQLRNAA